MNTRKDAALGLRGEGKSYREIERAIGVSRSTLSYWFRENKLSDKVKITNINRSIESSTQKLIKMNAARSIVLEKKYKDIEEEAEREFETYKNDPLFTAGLMLYAGEGDKMTKGVIRLSNTDFPIHRVFLRFIERFMNISPEKIKLSLILYPDLNIEDCKNKWSKELNIPKINFHKPQVIIGRSKIRRLHFGVGSIIISNSFLKRKLLLWIEKAKDLLSK